MYGKKRIVINKKNQIILAGDKSWIPIGVSVKMGVNLKINSKFLKIENRWDRKLTDDNSISISTDTMKETRGIISKYYNIT